MSVVVERRANLIHVIFSGSVDAAQLMEAGAAIDRIDRETPGLHRLVDATAVGTLALDFASMAGVADNRRRWSLASHTRTAILVGSDVTFGFARMYQDLLRHPRIAVEVFRDLDGAMAWLEAGRRTE